jgi:hypothetical protein
MRSAVSEKNCSCHLQDCLSGDFRSSDTSGMGQWIGSEPLMDETEKQGDDQQEVFIWLLKRRAEKCFGNQLVRKGGDQTWFVYYTANKI